MFYIYARVSTDDQETENQASMLERKYPGSHIIKDVVSGGKTLESRPKLMNLMARWERGDTVLVYKYDRLSRDLPTLMAIFDQAEKDGVTIKSETEPNVQGETAAKIMMRQIFGVFASFERNIIRERTKLGLARAKAEGKKLGGYRETAGQKGFLISERQYYWIKNLRIYHKHWENITVLFKKEFPDFRMQPITLKKHYEMRTQQRTRARYIAKLAEDQRKKRMRDARRKARDENVQIFGPFNQKEQPLLSGVLKSEQVERKNKETEITREEAVEMGILDKFPYRKRFRNG